MVVAYDKLYGAFHIGSGFPFYSNGLYKADLLLIIFEFCVDISVVSLFQLTIFFHFTGGGYEGMWFEFEGSSHGYFSPILRIEVPTWLNGSDELQVPGFVVDLLGCKGPIDGNDFLRASQYRQTEEENGSENLFYVHVLKDWLG